MSIDTGTINQLSTFLTGLGIAFLITLWLSLIIWVYRDIRMRSTDVLVCILAVAVSIILFLPGVLIYLILRPALTTEEKYQQALEEEALLSTLEESELCPGCERNIKDDWLMCPSCHTVIKKLCPACKNLLELAWDICPYCGLELEAQKPNRIDHP
jgi:RNA polymerase subunit RPABC4/transcription elongation factor Spt4